MRICLGWIKSPGWRFLKHRHQVSNELPIPSAIGQGTHSYTTSQLARYATVLASSGNVYNLSLLDKSTDSDGNLIEDYTPEMIDHVELSQGIWDDVHVGMEGVITKSNWGIFQDLNVTLAGKTGTAQQSKNRANHSLFIGYAPTDKPQIAWAIRIANGYASTNSELVAKDILNYYFGLKDDQRFLPDRQVQPAIPTQVQTDRDAKDRQYEQISGGLDMSEVIVVTSGKGGVGKTTTAANIGTGLAALDKKVVLVDTDIGLRNLDVVLGLENRIVYNLVDVIEGNCRLKQALIRDKRYANLFLLPSAQTRDKTSVTPEQMKKLCEELKKQFDYSCWTARQELSRDFGMPSPELPKFW